MMSKQANLHNQTVGILLAAGQSSRFGSDKTQHRLPESGLSMLEQSARALQRAMRHCVTVVRSEAWQNKRLLDSIGMPWVDNNRALSGMSSSLHCGMAFYRQQGPVGAWLFALADMPFISMNSIQSVLDAMDRGASIAAPSFQGKRGHPVAFAKQFEAELLNLRGDSGARSVIDRHRELLTCIEVDDVNVIRDIDTPFCIDTKI